MPAKKNDKNQGRPSLYKPEYNDLALRLCKLGAKDSDLAEFFEVDEATINNWKISHPSFFESLKKGKEIADADVADSLYRQAVGFERDEIELKVVSKGGKDGGSEVQAIPVKKFYRGDTLAMIFWLKNRQPKWWRDRIDNVDAGKAPIVWNETKTYKGDKPKKK